jgi:hypothetical protein
MGQHAPHFVVIGNPVGRRVELFQAALARLGLPPAQLVSYLALLAGEAALPEFVRQGSVVRIESPGKDFAVERALLGLGVEEPDEECAADYERLPRDAAQRLAFDRGRLVAPRQWYLGYRAALRLIENQLAACPPHRLLNAPAEIAAMFDKRRCHSLLQERGVPVPRVLGPVNSFNELMEQMRQTGCRRVFVKLAHGSSASGVVAYQTDSRRHRAVTTVEVVKAAGEPRLYNSRRLRVYDQLSEVAELIDTLCRQCVHVEQWIPKAGFANHICDLRVVVIAGRARHTVLRLSRNPLTNLHLLNARGDLAAFKAHIGATQWTKALKVCEQALACFPQSFYAGVDLLFAPGFQRMAVAEVNAFGDLLPGVLCEGADTYAAEVLALQMMGAAVPQC